MTPQDIGDIFLRDYLVAMYLATLGVVQIGASYGGLRGMLFLRAPRAARWLGIALMAIAFAYFITVPLWEDGPWGAESPTGVRGRDGLTVEWDTAGWSELGGARNLNDVDGGLSGGSQGIWFPLAAGLALISTFLISSAINRGMRTVSSAGQYLDGAELLKSATWAAAIKPSLAAWRSNWREIVSRDFGDDREWGGLRWAVNRWRRQ